ncbi:hypothetical protein KFL_001410300 [Klebsormidium nitens]|uniref:Uncharacterized protein n=1 Tax=Klebsormidium nitens TaxID=105231 RepID=A0A0U9HNR8_KLENI|nr:hypothetical protein KFL_001410300 [Klebsormidium nitens]|eukprot:GAQ83273.1 hypothetical protein KFL_001410300 [Klebsormidium nitens]
MPKTPRTRSRASHSSLSTPYAKRSKSDVEDTAGSVGGKADAIGLDETELWEVTRCCICLESPHNGVLLLCASSDRGCRPYVCDTSARHSNCLDTYKRTMTECVEVEGKEREFRLPCPLCRGTVTGQKINKGARHYWNQKERPCAKESCSFKAKYTALRRHARKDHPNDRPTEVKPEQAQSWQRAEREREMQDVLSAAFSGPNGEPQNAEPESRGWTVYFLFHMLDGEIGGFSVARRFVMGPGPARRASRQQLLEMTASPDSESEDYSEDEAEQQPVAPPTHHYYTRSRQEAPQETQPTDNSGAGTATVRQQGEATGSAGHQPAYRTRSVGLGETSHQNGLDGAEETGLPLSWRGVSGAGGVGGRRLRRLGRFRLVEEVNAEAEESEAAGTRLGLRSDQGGAGSTGDEMEETAD